MRQFDEQLLRLKQCLGLTMDSEVAAALGMSKAAFSNRKQAGSFPEDKVVLLKGDYPDLDVMYVLTGQRWDSNELVLHNVMATGAAARKDARAAGAVARAYRVHADELAAAADDPQVRELLGMLMFCDREAIQKVAIYAARLMGRELLPFSQRGDSSGSLLGTWEPPAPNAPSGKKR